MAEKSEFEWVHVRDIRPEDIPDPLLPCDGCGRPQDGFYNGKAICRECLPVELRKEES